MRGREEGEETGERFRSYLLSPVLPGLSAASLRWSLSEGFLKLFHGLSLSCEKSAGQLLSWVNCKRSMELPWQLTLDLHQLDLRTRPWVVSV